jgi:hypothetical protein
LDGLAAALNVARNNSERIAKPNKFIRFMMAQLPYVASVFAVLTEDPGVCKC